MTELSFELIRAAWNKIKVANPIRLKQLVPGVTNLNSVYVMRIDEDQQYLTIAFRGFENVVSNPSKDLPMLKRAIFEWLKKFSSGAQIERGDPNSFVVRLMKDVKGSPMEPVTTEAAVVPSVKRRPRDLVNIIMVRNIKA